MVFALNTHDFFCFKTDVSDNIFYGRNSNEKSLIYLVRSKLDTANCKQLKKVLERQLSD